MEKEKHLKNQVLYITNPAYDALHSEDLLEVNDEEVHQKTMDQIDIEN